MSSSALARSEAAETLTVARARGSMLFDSRGKRYIDFLAGWCVGNLGWALPEIRDAMRRSRAPEYVYPYYAYKPWDELAERLAEAAPGNLRKVYRATGGTEAVDIALQIAMVSKGRKKFIALEDSYHGNSVGTVSIAARESREPFPNLLSGCMTVELPLDDRAAGKIETMLKNRDVAAFVMEPVCINLGVYVPETSFMERLRRLCTKYGTLLILDEVASGFGRTGKLFATEHYDIEPDILCLGKAITAGYAPMGATLTTEKVAKSIQGKAGFYSTYGWHPLSVDAALANLRYWRRHGKALFANIERIGALFSSRLAAMKVKKVRIKGLAIGIELERETPADKVVAKCLKNGLLLASEGDSLTILPPLNIDEKTAAQGLDILQQSLGTPPSPAAGPAASRRR
jgi:adenosylmethionine-8-amino-7-oxononanoate aminotransferase